MSHQPERTEKNCLNCGTEVQGRYCHRCGQENIVPHQNFWSLTTHFIYDIFHFDGKFFDTLRHLLFRPGRVPLEYVAGRRMHYLDPIRMYLFTSAVFFLIFFSLSNMEDVFRSDEEFMSHFDRMGEAAQTLPQLHQRPVDSAVLRKMNMLLDTNSILELAPVKDSLPADAVTIVRGGKTLMLVAERQVTDSMEVNMGNDGTDVDNWLEKRMDQKWKEEKAASGGDINNLLARTSDEFLHRLPYLLFLSLPLFALILKLLYVRRKQFFYSDHAVFTLYHYIFSFILLLLLLGINRAQDRTGWAVWGALEAVLSISWFVYLLVAIKRFYKQGWGKTFVKFFLLNILAFFALLILFTLFVLLSIIF